MYTFCILYTTIAMTNKVQQMQLQEDCWLYKLHFCILSILCTLWPVHRTQQLQWNQDFFPFFYTCAIWWWFCYFHEAPYNEIQDCCIFNRWLYRSYSGVANPPSNFLKLFLNCVGQSNIWSPTPWFTILQKVVQGLNLFSSLFSFYFSFLIFVLFLLN